MKSINRLDGPQYIRANAIRNGIACVTPNVATEMTEYSDVLWFQDGGFLTFDFEFWKYLTHKRKVLIGPNFDLSDIRLKQFLNGGGEYFLLFPSEWVRDIAIGHFGFSQEICYVWAMGVEQEVRQNSQSRRDKVIVYVKHQNEMASMNMGIIQDFCSSHGYGLQVFIYGKYRHSLFMRSLKRAKFVIWFGITESQSIAQFEIWAQGVPSLIFKQEQVQLFGTTFAASSSPYLTKQTGQFFSNVILSMEDLEQFNSSLPKFTPSSWIAQSGEIKFSLRELYRIAST